MHGKVVGPVLCAAVATAACLTTPSPPSFDDAAIAAACTDKAMAVCALRSSCSAQTNDGDYSNAQAFGTDATCIQREAIVCINLFHVTDQNTTLDDVTACTSAFDGDTCSDFFDSVAPARCIVVPGPGANGSPCTVAQQCKSEFCGIPTGQ